MDAFASLHDPALSLVIAGNDLGAGRAIRSRVARDRVGDQTLFTGLLTGRARLEVLTDADVLVQPARDEIFGPVPVEALLPGTPVVVADDSGCGEVVARTGGGRIVPQGDAPALAAAIRGRLIPDSTTATRKGWPSSNGGAGVR